MTRRQPRGYAGRAFAAGKRSATTGELPPGYVALVERLAALVVQWCEAQPTLPDLRWLDPGTTMFIGGLQGEPVKYLADSPDAFRLIEWLDEQTDRKGTLFQVTIALRELGHLPGGTPPDVVGKSSSGMRHFETFAHAKGTDTRHESKPCPHCGKGLDASSGEKDQVPRVGDLSVCCYCGGIMRFGEGLSLAALSEEDLDALADGEHAEEVATVREMRDLFRASKMRSIKHRGVQA